MAPWDKGEDKHGHAQKGGAVKRNLGTSRDAWMSKEECWTRISREDEAQYPVLVVCQAVMNHSFPTVML